MQHLLIFPLLVFAILTRLSWAYGAESLSASKTFIVKQDHQSKTNSLYLTNLLAEEAGLNANAQNADKSQDTPPRRIWFPAVPHSIDGWSATKVTFEPNILHTLGDPPLDSELFTNYFGESVETQVIAITSYAAYFEPAIVMTGENLERTAAKIIYPFGANLPVRSLVFKKPSGGVRVISYEWVQRKEGTTEVPNEDSLQQEFRKADREEPVRAEPGCIVRAIITVNSADPLGRQARRDLEIICRGLYVAFKKNGDSTLVSAKGTPPDPLGSVTDVAAMRLLLAEYATATKDETDRAYLTTQTTTQRPPNQSSDNLLPLTAGDFWQMRSQSGNKVSQDMLKVIGPVTPPGGVASIQVDINREGTPWRKELYSTGENTGIYLTAVKDETSPLLVFNKPMPLLRYGFKEGDEYNWQGSVRISGKNYSAIAVSRLSTIEPLTTPAGKFQTLRIDTIFTVQINGHPMRFPSVRWLAPSVGFVRRAYADKGQPATSEVTHFHIR